MDIKGVIKAHGYTLEKVASEWKNGKGTTKGSISKMINNNPTVETLQAVADVIGCKVGDFFADEKTLPESKYAKSDLDKLMVSDPRLSELRSFADQHGVTLADLFGCSIVCPACGQPLEVVVRMK